MVVRYRYLFVAAMLCGGALLLLTANSGTDLLFFSAPPAPSAPSWHSHHYDVIDSDDTFTIKTEGCTIPSLRPFDESVIKFSQDQKRPKSCQNANYSLLDNNETHIWIRSEHFKHFHVPADGNISCCYKSFYRPSSVEDIYSSDVDERVQYEPCIYFSSYIEVMNEFVKVFCEYEYLTIYEQFFLFTPKKPSNIYKIDSVEVVQNQSAYNILVLGIDAVSRLNFYRTMPKTVAYLKKKGAIELYGYNKVGDNTFPNLTPMLLGVKDVELKRTCWPHMRATFDNCPFIWEWFKDAGYYTALGEDSASLGTFNFEKFGFIGTPTDYYIHTFINEAEKDAGNNRDFNSFICMGNKYFFSVLLDYIESLTSTLKSSKLFGFFWEVTMSHDYLNYPTVMDDRYVKLFKSLDSSNYLEDTIIILLSDHGIRWGDIRYTKQGRLEERLPFVHVLLPTSFRENYSLAYTHLKINSRRLSTPFDIHATLSDLVDLETIKNDKLKIRSEEAYAQERSISLFLPVPRNRTCKSAGIDDHWCTCHRGQKLSTESGEAREAAMHLIRHLNTLVRDHTQCARLKLAEVVEMTEMLAGTPRDQEVGWREFTVVVRASPGGGVFEATLRHDKHSWALAGTVSRLNLYGDQSRCIHHYQLKLYCYCK